MDMSAGMDLKACEPAWSDRDTDNLTQELIALYHIETFPSQGRAHLGCVLTEFGTVIFFVSTKVDFYRSQKIKPEQKGYR